MADVNISKYRASVVRDGSKPASPGFVVSEGQDPVNPPGTNNFVPYTGATANVELGEFGVEAGFVTLDTTPTNIPTDQGAIYWDDTRSTAALIMNGTLQHIGQDSFFYVKNSSGSTIAKGTCVGFAGTDGASGHLLITPFLANGSVPSTYFMGVTSEEIANGSFGQVMHFGELTGINTSGFTAGALLYASSTVAGGFQTTAPVAPNNIILVAAAVNSKNNGAIVVRPTLGSNINSDEGVKITSPTTGDLLQLQAGGLWENKTIDGAGIVTKATSQVISGLKTFNVNTLMMQSSGNANAVYLSNSSGSSTYQSGFNFFGFNTDNHIYFAKSSITGGNTGILAWTNTATRTYTLKDASGTLAFTSDIPANPVGGTGTTNYLPKFTGTSTIGNSVIQDNGSLVSIGVATTVNGLIQSSISASGSTAVSLDLRNTVNALNSNSSMYFSVGSGSLSSTNITAIIRGIVTQASALKSDLTFFTNSGDSVIEAMRLTSSGNLGLGVTPSAWGSSGVVAKALQVNNISLASTDSNGMQLSSNAYWDGSSWRYIASSVSATNYFQGGGSHGWRTATSGTAGNAISFTQAMTLTSGGNLLVGTTSDNGARLQVSGTATFSGAYGTSSGVYLSGSTYGTYGANRGATSASAGMGYFSVGSQRWFTGIYENSDNFGFYSVGTNGFPLILNYSTGAATFSSSVTAGGTLTANTGTGATFRAVFGGTNVIEVGNYNATDGYRELLLSGSPISFYTSNAGASSVTERMRITSGGNVGIGTSSPATLLQVEGSAPIFTMNRTSGGFINRINFSSGGTNYASIISDAGAGEQRYSIGPSAGWGGYHTFYTDTTERMRITSSGNVGIGTTTFAYSPRLAVASVGQNSIAIQTTDTVQGSAGTILYLGTGSSTGSSTYGQIVPLGNGGTSAANLVLQPTGSNGNVLIGTTTDVGARLHVNGDVRTAAPTGGSAVNWRLGTVRGGTVTPNATVRVEIGGVLVDLDARYV